MILFNVYRSVFQLYYIHTNHIFVRLLLNYYNSSELPFSDMQSIGNWHEFRSQQEPIEWRSHAARTGAPPCARARSHRRRARLTHDDDTCADHTASKWSNSNRYRVFHNISNDIYWLVVLTLVRQRYE